MPFFVGIDWATDVHAICVIDESGRARDRFRTPHTAAGITELIERLQRLAPAQELPIAIERPSGALVDTLVQNGHPVVPIHPNAVKAARPRYSAAGAKSDPGDAYLLADLLRTDGHRFRPLKPLSDQTRALRALVRTRDDLVAHRIALTNQLRSILESFWAGAANIFADLASPIALAFLTEYPTPTHAAKIGPKRLARFLARHAYCGRKPPLELLDRMRCAVKNSVGELEAQGKGELVRSLAAILQTVVAELNKLTATIEHDIAAHADSWITSFPHIGRVNAAQIFVELGEDRTRFATDAHLAAEAGVAPVTRESGKHRAVAFRWACNKRLRKALTCWAANSRRSSPWAARTYDAARARGCGHPHAVRILARAWTRVLWRCWQDAQRYDLSRHRAAA